MLNVLRESFKNSPWLRIVLIVVALAMTLYLAAYFTTPPPSAEGGEWVARVDGQAVTRERVRRYYERLERQFREQLGPNYEQFKPQLQLGRQALDQIIDRELILADARRIGITEPSADALRDELLAIPAIRDARAAGQEQYRNFVRLGLNMTPEAFEREVREDLMIGRWTALVTEPVSVTDGELEQLHRADVERTEIDYFLVAAADQQVDTRVDDAEARRWYDAHASDYERPDGRRIRYLVVSREAQQAKIEVTDEELRQSYETNLASYSHPEQRRARHILFSLDPGADEQAKSAAREEAEAALRRIEGGADFAALAQELSDDPGSASRGGDLGFFGRGQMVPSFEEAAFGTPPGQLAPLTESQFGFHVIEVLEAREAGARSFEEVREEIRRSVRNRRALENMATEAQRIRDLVATADDLANVAAAEGLAVESRFVSEGEPLGDLGAAPDFAPTVFGLAAGGVTPPLRVAGGLAIVAVDEVVPAAIPPFDEVAAEVRGDVIDERARQKALEVARAALEKRKGRFADAAKALGKEPKNSGELRPGGSVPEAAGGSPALQERLFGEATAAGDTGAVVVPAGAIVYEVKSREAFDRGTFEARKAQLREEELQQRRGALVTSVLDRLRRDTPIERDQAWVERLGG